MYFVGIMRMAHCKIEVWVLRVVCQSSSLCTGIFEIRAPPAKTKLLSVKFELGPLHICWKFSDP